MKAVNPIALMLEVFEERYPDSDCLVVFADAEEAGGEKGCGLTLFPDDGSRPRVVVDVSIPFFATLEILAHELSHVVCGEKEDHGPEWEATMKHLYDLWSAKFLQAMDEAGLSREVAEE